MTTLPRCLSCDQPLDDPAWRWRAWCAVCVDAVLDELLAMADLRPGEVATIAEILRLAGARTMASVITRVPFAARPTAAELERLTHE